MCFQGVENEIEIEIDVDVIELYKAKIQDV